MTPQEFRAYTQQLIDVSQADPRIISLIVLGSTAETHHQPDQWSDHDFWLVVQDGTETQFRDNLSWVPNHEQIVLAFPETAHGGKVVFRDGHVLEYAIFRVDELEVVRFHHYKTLVDKADVEQQLQHLKAGFPIYDPTETDALRHAQNALSLIVIGMGRYHRGEKISGHLFIKHHALEQLHALIQATIKPQEPQLVDHLSPSRRIELTHPQYADRLHAIITASVPASAHQIVDLIVSLQDHIPDFPSEAIETVRQAIDL